MAEYDYERLSVPDDRRATTAQSKHHSTETPSFDEIKAAMQSMPPLRKEAFVMSERMLEQVKRQMMTLVDNPSTLYGIPVHTYRTNAEKVELMMRLRQDGVKILLVQEESDG